MKYIVTGEMIKAGRMVSPGDFTQILNKGIILTLGAYKNLGYKKNIPGNENLDDTRTGVAILEGDSHEDVNRELENLPNWCQVDWTVTPVEN